MTHVTPAVPAGAASPSPRPADRGYVVAPAFAVRVAALPVEVLERLRATRTWEIVDELAETTAWLEREGTELSDLLYGVIGEVGGDPARAGLKPALVALRRAVFTGRRPDRRALSAEVLGALPTGLAVRVRSWAARRDRQAALRAALPDVLAAETREKIALLREATGADVFRLGLEQSSPVLAERLRQGRIGRQERLALARYLARATVKTSPYATFTLSGFGRWTDSGPAVQPAEELSWTGDADLDRAVLQPMWAALARLPQVVARARLRVNPTAVDDGERVWFLGPGGAEQLRSVPAAPEVRRALAWVRTHPCPTVGAAPALLPLVRAGLLEPLPPYEEQSADPVGELAAWLAAGPGGDAPRLAAVGRLAAALRDDRLRRDQRRLIETVRRALEDVFAPAKRDQPWLPDKNLCTRTAVLTHQAGRCALPEWRPALDDLDVVRRLLGLFDPDLPVKIAATAFFLDRYGAAARVPVLDLYRELHTGAPGAGGALLRALLGDPLAVPDAAFTAEALPRLRELAALRRDFWAATGAGPDARDEVVRVDPDRLAALAASWPGYIRPPGSVSCFVQPLPGPDGLRLVLNTVLAGYGRGLSRLHRLAGPYAPPLADLRAGRGEVLVAECRGMLGGGINLRSATADRALAYPFTGDRDAAAGLPVLSPADLTVTCDGDRLVLRDPDGRPVLPVHLGMSAQHWLPPGLQFLIRAFGEPATAMVPGWVFRTGGNLPEPGVVERWPRLDVGRVTLARACLRLRAAEVPTPGRGEDDAAYLPRLAAWLARHGVPRRFFARVVGLGDGLGMGLLGKGRKPMYVDVTDPFLLTGFLRELRDPDALVVLEEALPDPAGAPRYGGHGRRVTEYLVQLTVREPQR
ncbi:hypothetical protein GCM10010106_18330 [Thermopolyspora flexuosa]|uniref:Lantibiotic biosynthesis dehydratase-like protein n=1 Tax=Thermopolyspora flexuosa TaxID=103836 RepID=A0A543J429_9ACTN|nr:lantibiotic dehydratase [Thermopolyspora flexuosa]TQM77580.1 lantibiotic biosynthesis dehydratase-like protein [Thermopolyspora flexuosa]GGM72333.1 hypothetical protein GCM10010106_18330 [Thermopolyspora flexuosa]